MKGATGAILYLTWFLSFVHLTQYDCTRQPHFHTPWLHFTEQLRDQFLNDKLNTILSQTIITR